MSYNVLRKKKQISKERPTQQGLKSTNKNIYLTLHVFLFSFLSKCRSWAVWIWKLTREVEDETRNRRRKRRKKKRFQRQLKTRNEDKKMGREHAKHGRKCKKLFVVHNIHTYTHSQICRQRHLMHQQHEKIASCFPDHRHVIAHFIPYNIICLVFLEA